MQISPNIYDFSLQVQISIPISSGNGSRLSTLIKNGTLLTAVNLPGFMINTNSSTGSPSAAMTNAQQCLEVARRVVSVIIESPSAGFDSDFIAAMTNQVARASSTLYQTVGAFDGAYRTFVRSQAAAFNAFAICLCTNTPNWRDDLL